MKSSLLSPRTYQFKNLKAAAVFLLLASCTLSAAKAQTILWSQNFNSSALVSSYVGSGANQFDAISTADSSSLAWSINGNSQLQMVRSSNTTYGAATRTTDIDLGPVQAGFLRLDFNAISVTSQTSAFGYAINVAVGSGFTSANSVPTPSSIFAQYGISTLTSNTSWSVQNRNTTPIPQAVTPFVSGLATITLIFNNSGASQSYNFGDGVSGAVLNDTFDLWIGTDKIFNGLAVTTPGMTSAITDFKIGWVSNGQGSMAFDNIAYGSIPEPSTILLLGGAGAVFGVWRVCRRSRRVALSQL